MGGHFGVTAKCQLDFPNSRMCTLEEVAATTTVPVGLSGSAWVHSPHSASGAVIFDATVLPSAGLNCAGWKSEHNEGWQVGTDGVDTSGGGHSSCDNTIPGTPIACCALVP